MKSRLTRQITHPSKSHSLTVVFDAVEISEPEVGYHSTVAVRVIDIETDYNEEGEIILPEWVTIDLINEQI